MNDQPPILSILPSSCVSLAAHDQFLQDFGKKKKAVDRETAGDFLGTPKPALGRFQRGDRGPGFFWCSLFQGDRLGVEIACCAHAKMLEEAGCHADENRLVQANLYYTIPQ